MKTIYIKTQEDPAKFTKFEFTDEQYYSMLSKGVGLDIDEIKDRESGKVIDTQYSNFKSGFEFGIREALRLIYAT